MVDSMIGNSALAFTNLLDLVSQTTQTIGTGIQPQDNFTEPTESYSESPYGGETFPQYVQQPFPGQSVYSQGFPQSYPGQSVYPQGLPPGYPGTPISYAMPPGVGGQFPGRTTLFTQTSAIYQQPQPLSVPYSQFSGPSPYTANPYIGTPYLRPQSPYGNSPVVSPYGMRFPANPYGVQQRAFSPSPYGMRPF